MVSEILNIKPSKFLSGYPILCWLGLPKEYPSIFGLTWLLTQVILGHIMLLLLLGSGGKSEMCICLAPNDWSCSNKEKVDCKLSVVGRSSYSYCSDCHRSIEGTVLNTVAYLTDTHGVNMVKYQEVKLAVLLFHKRSATR